MAITGTHTLLYSSEPEQLRAMLRDVFNFKGVDIGHGWMIFSLPPSEIAVHPGEGPTFEAGVRHQFTLMCDDIKQTVSELKAKGVKVADAPKQERWGIHVTLNLPGGCDVMVYEPRHPVVAGLVTKPTKSRKRTTTKGTKKNVTPPPDRRAKKAARRP